MAKSYNLVGYWNEDQNFYEATELETVVGRKKAIKKVVELAGSPHCQEFYSVAALGDQHKTLLVVQTAKFNG